MSDLGRMLTDHLAREIATLLVAGIALPAIVGGVVWFVISQIMGL